MMIRGISAVLFGAFLLAAYDGVGFAPGYGTTSEGVSVIGADIIHAHYTGKDVRVAIFAESFDTANPEISGNISQYVDFDTRDNAESVGNPAAVSRIPLPAMSAMPADASGILGHHDIQGMAVGTAAAEIVVDVAPDVRLYLYITKSNQDFELAMDDAVANNMDIILCTINRHNGYGDIDGTSFLSMQASTARENNILWISPAGDTAKRHWHGDWRNDNNSEISGPYHYFVDPSDPGLGDESTLVLDGVASTDMVWAVLSWNLPSVIYGMAIYNDWNEVGHIYEIQKDANPSNILEHTFGDMSHGTSGNFTISDPAIEIFWDDVLSGSSTPGQFRLILSHDIRHHGYRVAESSIQSPGDSRDSLTVGAVLPDGTPDQSSSQGPTMDGRTKPDVMAPSSVSTFAISQFNGTAAAASHVAGMAAILAEKFPSAGPALLHTMIEETTTDHGKKTNHGGTGIVSLSGFSSDVMVFGPQPGCTVCFYPRVLAMPAGHASWTNVSGMDLHISVNGTSFDIQNGETASMLLDKDGTYRYHAAGHADTAEILVGTGNDMPPVIISASVISGNAIRMEFSEPVNADIPDFHSIILLPGGPRSPVSIMGSGTDSITVRFDGEPVPANAHARVSVGTGVADLAGMAFAGMDLVASDMQAPSVVAASLTGPNQISTTFDEPATAVKFHVMVLGQPRTILSTSGSGTDHTTIRFDGEAVPSLGTGLLTMHGLSDNNGNIADTATKITDGQAPSMNVVEFLGMSGPESRSYDTGDSLLLRMEPDERIKDVRVRINGDIIKSAEDRHSVVWTAAKVISEYDAAGPIRFTIDFEDMAGNPADTIAETTHGITPHIGANQTAAAPVPHLDPEILLARITGPATLQIAFAEPVMATRDLFSNFRISGESTPRDITGLSGSGTDTLTLSFAGMAVSSTATGMIDILPGIIAAGKTYGGIASHIILDGQAPIAEHVRISKMPTDAAGTGTTILLEFSFSEHVLMPVTTIHGMDVMPESMDTSYMHWRAVHTVGADARGAIEFSITYSDVSGNSGTVDTTTDGSAAIMDARHAPTTCRHAWNPGTESCEEPYTQHKTTISGVIFSDTNWNGIRDAGEPGIAGYSSMIAIDLENHTKIETYTTSADGTYSFEVNANSTTLVQTSYLPENHVVYDPNASWFTYVVSPDASHTFNVGFHNVTESELAELEIRTYVDQNGNMQRDAGEPGVPWLGADTPTFQVYTYMIGPVSYPYTGMDGTATVRLVPSDFALLADVPALENIGYHWTSTSYERFDDYAGKIYDSTYPVADDPEPGSKHIMDVGLSVVLPSMQP